jgi:ribosomal protein S18 acetylase RimI-like enzyme
MQSPLFEGFLITVKNMKKTISIEKINLRSCRVADLKFVYDLMKLNMEKYVTEYWGEWNQKKFKDSLKKEHIEVIGYNKKRIGFFNVTRKGLKSYLHNIQLISSFQGCGIGTGIMTLIEQKEKLAGSKKIEAKVFKKNPALSFYHKLGYKTIKEGGHALIISKNL